MNTSEQILVIILSIALAIFLMLAIVLAVQAIRLMKLLQEIAIKAQGLVDSAEATADLVKRSVGQLSLLRFAHSIVDLVTKHQKK
ncbi:MAG TPA: hypothetical protein VLH38_00970 [Patescibacteria group bacterium]|nr:hypothetical protein [Patescibacteria group bacterium]